MRIGLIVCVDDEIEKTQMFGIKYMPVWAYTLASHLRDVPNIEIFLHDTRIKGKLNTPAADVYFISGINQDHTALLDYHHHLKLKNPKAITVLGGPIIASYKLAGKLDLLNTFDHLFYGDGEESVANIVEKIKSNNLLPKLIENHKKFRLSNSRPMDFKLIRETVKDYYGAVIEVSRGCPFLCEFCDIRTKPDNNTADNKHIEVILKELEEFSALGVRNILLACDNFIGSVTWAEAFCDAIIDWKKCTGHQPRFYTWLTINLAYHPRLLAKMKLAGFDMFFIGIESFGMDQLLETAKLQNANADIKECIKTVQSYGFIVVAGLIFGFDTDPDNVVLTALEGIKTSGLISGDPSLLTALPGTPLYRRMELSNRLRKSKLGLGGKKYVTNILYLKDKNKMIEDFIYFVHEFNSPIFQLARYENFLNCLGPNSRISEKNKSYINPASLFKLVLKEPSNLLSLFKRFYGVINSSAKIIHVSKALYITLNRPEAKLSYFYFWLFNWSNSVLKYDKLAPMDFDIDCIGRSPILSDVLPDSYDTDYFEPIPENKIRSQRKATVSALSRVFTNAE